MTATAVLPPSPPHPARLGPPPPPAWGPVAGLPPAPRRRWWRRSWVARAVALAAVLAVLAVDRGPLGAVVVVFVLVVPFEKLFPRHRQRLRRPGLGTDLAWALTGPPLGVAGFVVGLVVGVLSFAWLPGLLLRPLVLALPALPRAILGVLLFDLAIYWTHRFGHEVPFLWRFHRVHHSTRHLDWISGFRNHPFDGVLLAPAFVLLLAAGFRPELAGALVVVQVALGLFLHANVRWRWRPLQRLVITPEFHHWHHANERQAYNTNYSTFLPVWDLLFRTYSVPADRRPTVYGVDGTVPPGLVGQLWEPLRGLRNPLRAVRHPVRAGRETAVAVRRGVGQMAASARRRSGPPERIHPVPV
jgi:sterol desaturase/sphingolipid hydroxylase (fatty acid hydroxylase superfamily)